MSDRLYLDHNATSPLRPEAREAMAAAFELHNPSSTHTEGRRAKRVLEDARAVIAERAGAAKESVIFTSGGTEADNLALYGAVRGPLGVRRLFVSAIEHDAVMAAAKALKERREIELEIVPVTAKGVVDLEWLRWRFEVYDPQKEGAFLLCVMAANNETGVIQPIEKLGPIVWPKSGLVFSDAVQAFGKIPLDFQNSGADLMAIGAHKIGGPTGAGALLTKTGIALGAAQRGGGQELYRRAGTENLVAIAGFAAAARVGVPDSYAPLSALRDRIEASLPAGVTVWGAGAPRLPNTLCFSAPNFRSETQTMVMDLAGIAVSAGSACSSGKVRKSGVITAMGGSAELAECGLRVSLGWDTPEDADEQFLRIWIKEYERISQRSAA